MKLRGGEVSLKRRERAALGVAERRVPAADIGSIWRAADEMAAAERANLEGAARHAVRGPEAGLYRLGMGPYLLHEAFRRQARLEALGPMVMAIESEMAPEALPVSE